jgi:hypothetical protein
MLNDRGRPRTEPLLQRGRKFFTFHGVFFYGGPFLRIQLAHFVEDVGVNADFSYVMQESRPAKSVSVG